MQNSDWLKRTSWAAPDCQAKLFVHFNCKCEKILHFARWSSASRPILGWENLTQHWRIRAFNHTLQIFSVAILHFYKMCSKYICLYSINGSHPNVFNYLRFYTFIYTYLSKKIYLFTLKEDEDYLFALGFLFAAHTLLLAILCIL